MQLTIHIGPHKSGTTAIQTAFARAAPRLRRDGLLYPRLKWRETAHHRLACALKGRPIPRQDIPDLERELPLLQRALGRFSGPRALISSEEFFTCPAPALEILKSALDMPIEVVCYLRRPDDFLLSCYNQKVKQPGNRYAEPLERFLENPRAIGPEIDYLGAVGTWADVFGEEAVRLDTYEGPSPLSRLWSHLGLKGPPPRSPWLNASVPGVVLDVMREAKKAGLSTAKQQKLVHRASQTFADAPPLTIPDGARRAIIAEMEGDLTRLFARFGQANPFTLARFEPRGTCHTPGLTAGDRMRLIEALL